MPLNNKDKWGQLSMKQRADLISIYVNNGFSDIDSIREDYNKNVENFQSNDANFVQRLRDNDPKYVQNADGSVSTHKLNYATDDNGAIIYPSIQEQNGALVDHSEDNMGGLESAIQKKDTVRTSIPFAEWYTQNYKKDYSEFFNRYNKFDEGGDKLQYKNDDIEKQDNGKVPILPKILGIPRFIEKKTNGLISKDKVHYLYDSPEDWAKKIFNEEELDTIRHNLYENFTPIGYNIDDIVRFFNAAQGKNELVIPKEIWDKDVRAGYNQSGSIYGPAQRDEYFANYLGISPNERRGYSENNLLVRTDLKPTKGTAYDDVFSFNRKNNRYFEKNLVDTFFNAEDALKLEGLVNIDLGTFTGVRKIKKGKSKGSYLVQGMIPGLFGSIFHTLAKEDAASGTWILSSGIDQNKGQYISYYDDYDLNPSLGGDTAGNPVWLGMFPVKKGDASGGIGKPFTVYDRVYLDDYYGVDSKPEDGYYGGYIKPSIITVDKNAYGGLLDRMRVFDKYSKDNNLIKEGKIRNN